MIYAVVQMAGTYYCRTFMNGISLGDWLSEITADGTVVTVADELAAICHDLGISEDDVEMV